MIGAVAVAVRLLAGLLLLAAGALKLLDPVSAVLAVDAYDLLAPPAALAVGLLLPGVEIAIGAALVAGWRLRGAGLGAGALALVFLFVAGWARARDLDVDCGCFGPFSRLFADGGRLLLVDLALLAGALGAWHRAGPRHR